MKTRKQFSALLPALFLGAALLLGPAAGWSHPVADESGAKQDAKAVSKDTKKAAVTTGKDVKKGTGKAYHATKNGTKKVFHKTKTTTTGAVDGGKEGAKQ
jgi:hypothetical protein